MDFSGLDSLQRYIRSIEVNHVMALNHYHIQGAKGFRHIYGGSPTGSRFSMASTATCILSLTSAGLWTENEPWFTETYSLAKEMLTERWTSADLPDNNPFTVPFILEAVLALEQVEHEILKDPLIKQKKSVAINILKSSLCRTAAEDDKYATLGAANVQGYPPSTYLTQLVVRVLKQCNEFTNDIRIRTREWSWRQIEHELALLLSGSKSADALSLAYAILLFISCGKISEFTPDENHILQKAIDTVYDAQLADGSWPRSRPIFHYPRVGNAYCFEYEMLTQILMEKDLIEHSLRHLPKIALATERLKKIGFQFEEGGIGWASGHHPQLAGPESWSTASVYHFLYELDRVLAEAIRRAVFSYLGSEYRSERKTEFAQKFWDSTLVINGKQESLREVLLKRFIEPVKLHSQSIEKGRDLPKNVPISAVFFGPPGTSKTQLAREIANFLGWPLLTIDPSHLVRKGLDQVQAETNLVFSMLATTERIVVLLDEFDELARERTASQSEAMSRFLTTAMLPKLTLINDRRRIVFIVATNHINQFDFAIRRPGRFDLIIQIMPPDVKAKLTAISELKDWLTKNIGLDLDDDTFEKQISVLTYSEFNDLAKCLQNARNSDHGKRLIEDAYKNCTLRQRISYKHGENETWEDVCKEQASYIRVPGI